MTQNLTCDHTSEEWNIDELHSSIKSEIIILESGLEQQGDHGRSAIIRSFYGGMCKGPSGQQSGDKKGVSAKPVCMCTVRAHIILHIALWSLIKRHI